MNLINFKCYLFILFLLISCLFIGILQITKHWFLIILIKNKYRYVETINTRSTMYFLFLQLCATLGTTGACAFDKLEELGPICMKNKTKTVF